MRQLTGTNQTLDAMVRITGITTNKATNRIYTPLKNPAKMHLIIVNIIAKP